MSEAFHITVDTSEWEQFADKLDDTSLLEGHMRRAMEATLDGLVEMISAETPVGVSGNLRASWGQNVDIAGTVMDLRGIVMTPLIYGWSVEAGREPGTWPLEAAITLWAKRKFGLSGDKLETAVYFIRKSIFERGTKAAEMVGGAFRQMKGTMLERIWAGQLELFLEDLARG